MTLQLHMQTRKAAAGFSLIELLVVVSIIAILAGLLFPALQTGRASAQTGVCLSNQRSVGAAMLMFPGDHEGRLPWAEFVGSAASNQKYISWDDQLSEYDGRDHLTQALKEAPFLRASTTKDAVAASIYKCPAETRFDSHVVTGDILMRSYTMPRLGNALWNRGAGGDDLGAGIFNPVNGWSARLSQVPNPAETIMLAEVRGNQTRLGSINGIVVDRPFAYGSGSSQIHIAFAGMKALHDPSWNYLFCDGSARTLRPEDTLAPGRAWYTYMWSRNPND